MKLSKEQLKQFDEEGYLFFPSLFSKEETMLEKRIQTQ
jgi:ectoine hydroxylase